MGPARDMEGCKKARTFLFVLILFEGHIQLCSYSWLCALEGLRGRVICDARGQTCVGLMKGTFYFYTISLTLLNFLKTPAFKDPVAQWPPPRSIFKIMSELNESQNKKSLRGAIGTTHIRKSPQAAGVWWCQALSFSSDS